MSSLEGNALVTRKEIRDQRVLFFLFKIILQVVSTMPFSHLIIIKTFCLLLSFRNNIQVIYF